MFDESIRKWSLNFNVPEIWIRAVIQTESGWDPNAYRPEPQINDASYGLMQVLYKTATGLGYFGEPSGLFDPDKNIGLGTKLLGDLRKRYGDNVQEIYSAYNSGNPKRYLTSTQVAKNVQRFLANLQSIIESEPFIATAGSLSAVIAFLLIWYWVRKGGK